MLHHEFLIFLCAVFSNFDLEDVVQVFEKFSLQLARSVTFLAWQAFLIHLRAIASEAIRQIII